MKYCTEGGGKRASTGQHFLTQICTQDDDCLRVLQACFRRRMSVPGTYIDGPFDFATDPIGTVLTYGGCNPDFCTCNGSTEEFDARQEEEEIACFFGGIYRVRQKSLSVF